MANQSDPLAFESIRATIARYAIALDTKNFDLLKNVFTEDVDTIYPFLGELKGRQNVAATIESRLKPVTTQHALTTQLIDFDGGEATVTTYFTGIHFGKGKWKGKEVTAWGRYEDRLSPSEGADGTIRWLIHKRTLTFMGRLGEEGVMKGD